MKRQIIIGVMAVGALLFAAIGSSVSNQSSNQNIVQPTKTTSAAKDITEEVKVKPICDGTVITSGCTLDGINYKTYNYHPAVAEKAHNETVTTYREEITSYCTLCSDGTYSPSCATGRGACSHHGGVAQWNAPRYSSIPVSSTKAVVDAPAQEAFYDKIPE